MNGDAPLLDILKHLDQGLADALRLAAAGRDIDITALDDGIRRLCAHLEASPPTAEREAVKARLARLDAQLGDLATLLEKQLANPDTRMAGPGTAAEIYRRAQTRK